MKQKLIRTTAVLLLLATLVGLLPIFGSQTAVYSTESNSGQRDVICTTLDGTGAADYYGNEYSYNRLSELSEEALYDTLEELMTDTHDRITSYDDCKNYAVKTDCENNDGRIVTIYSSHSTTNSTYNNGQGWNREHVWPKSLGGFETKGAGADLHHIRPSESLINSTRGNMLYGNVSSGKSVFGNLSSSLGGYYSGGYFEPLDNVKGDVARICLYLYVRWADEYPKCANITNVFQSVDVLLDWCEQDPVDTWEMGRNEVVGAIQGNRNVFIDYPEYAWLLFGEEIPEGMTTPSGEAAEGEGNDPSCTHKNTEVKNASAATCGKAGYSGDTYCKDCGKKIKSGNTVAATGNHTFGEWSTNADGGKSRTCSVCSKVETEGVVIPGADATISFTDKAYRTAYTASQQVWKQNGITVTNDKAASTSNVGDYCNPGRFYKSSKVTVTAPGMTKIVIDCTGLETKYVTPWSNSFNDSNATASVSGGTVTITFQTPVDFFTWDTMSAQGRAYRFTVCTSAGGEIPGTTPEITPDPPVVIPSTLAGQIAAANGLANKEYLPYESTITGTVTDDPQASSYTEGQYKFTVSDGTNTILCYFTPVSGGTPAKGDTVTVTGKLTAYNGTAQFDSTASATLQKNGGSDGGDTPEVPNTTPEVTPPDTTPEITPPDTTPEGPPPATAPTDCTHANVEYRDAVEPSCKEGYSGDVYCADCGAFLEKGMVYPPVEVHQYDDATGRLICTICGHESANHTDDTDNTNDRVDTTEDDTSDHTVLLIVSLSLAGAAIAAVIVWLLLKKRKA
ncbi:MAG: endonuclease [Clostridia bacterium]|nr:endonuclease [Clostridia bacterium]